MLLRPVIAFGLALWFAPSIAFGQECGLSAGGSSEISTFTAKEDTFISTESLTNKHHWNGERKLWLWDNSTRSGTEFPNGSIMFISPKAIERKYAIPFEFGSDVRVWGTVCLGNIKFHGAFLLQDKGILLLEKYKMSYLR